MVSNRDLCKSKRICDKGNKIEGEYRKDGDGIEPDHIVRVRSKEKKNRKVKRKLKRIRSKKKMEEDETKDEKDYR